MAHASQGFGGRCSLCAHASQIKAMSIKRITQYPGLDTQGLAVAGGA